MASYRVKKSGKDKDGDITKLCGDWGNVTKAKAIEQLEKANGDRYYVEEEAPRVDVKVVTESGKKYLRTTADKTKKNNLDKLDDC